jgi:hypothetical protein
VTLLGTVFLIPKKLQRFVASLSRTGDAFIEPAKYLSQSNSASESLAFALVT